MKQYRYASLVSLILFLMSLMLLLMALVFSSCATDDSVGSVPNSSSDSTIVNLTFFISDGVKTRAINTANENIVSDITVLVFDNSNTLIGSKYVSSVAAASVDVPVTTRSATGCTVYAIANTGPDGYFSGVNTIDQLNAKYTTIASASALESAGSTSGSTGPLMVGKSSADISTGGANKFSITLYHQCGKFSFTITPASGVTITGYQLCNVPLSSYITDSHVPASASTVAGPPAGASSYGNFDAVSGLSQTTALSKTYYVYENLCGSNSNATTEALRNSSNVPVSASASASYLLVNAKGSSWTSTYRIYLGGVTNVATPATDLTNFNVYRNLSYQCNISLGANGGNGDARVTYSIISDRSNMYTGDATVGNYLYNDGTNGTAFKSGQTVGIIFSSEVTLAQYNDGCRHGRALALKDAYSGGCQWSTPSTSPYADRTVHPYYQKFSDCYNDVSSGYDASSSTYAGSSSNFAWYYCKTYSDGTTHSGSLAGRIWYLPSMGDWWDIIENLCTWTSDQKTKILGMRTSTSGIDTGMPSILIPNLSSSYYSTLDSKLTAASGSALVHDRPYWSASEYLKGYALNVDILSSIIYLIGSSKDGTYIIRVRAVLAF